MASDMQQGAAVDDTTGLERRFHEEMLGIYQAARGLKPPYYANEFLRMVTERGGHAAAEALLATAEPSQGFTELFLRGRRLDLSVEYLVLRNPWRGLFTSDQRAVARKRLRGLQFDPPPEDAAEEGTA